MFPPVKALDGCGNEFTGKGVFREFQILNCSVSSFTFSSLFHSFPRRASLWPWEIIAGHGRAFLLEEISSPVIDEMILNLIRLHYAFTFRTIVSRG